MKIEGMDVVYCLKNNVSGEELRYSLRSLENLKGIRNVWFYGGCPNWAKNIRHVPTTQGNTKWWNTANMLNDISQNFELSNNFIWFNDDFFVLRPCDKLDYWRDGLLFDRAERTVGPNGRPSRYGQNLLEAAEI